MSQKMQMTERAKMLMANSLDWYVVTLQDGEYDLKHSSELSSILECGHPMKDYGFTAIERCWNGQDLSTEDDWI